MSTTSTDASATEPQACCSTSELSTCCAPEDKGACCGSAQTEETAIAAAPSSCGCK